MPHLETRAQGGFTVRALLLAAAGIVGLGLSLVLALHALTAPEAGPPSRGEVGMLPSARPTDAPREAPALDRAADAEARYRRALTLPDRGERMAELLGAARLAPRDPRPRRALGEELLEEGRAAEGARLLLEAAALYSREELETAYSDLRVLLRSHGREEEEARLRERLEAFPP